MSDMDSTLHRHESDLTGLLKGFNVPEAHVVTTAIPPIPPLSPPQFPASNDASASHAPENLSGSGTIVILSEEEIAANGGKVWTNKVSIIPVTGSLMIDHCP